jgi:signal transduction histidine kinase
MSEGRIGRAGYTVIGVATALGVATVALGIRLGDPWSAVNNAILIPAFLTAAVLAMRAQPANGAVWALTGAGLFGVASSFGSHLAAWRTGIAVSAVEAGDIPGAPADYDTLAAIGIDVSLWAWIPAAFLLATFLLILFPAGRAPSRRWRAALWVAGASMVALSLQGTVRLAPWVQRPYATVLGEAEGTTMAGVIGLLMLPLMAIALAAVIRIVVMYRRTSGEERLQYRWVAWALGLYVVVGIFGFSALQTLGDLGGLVSTLLLANIPVSIAVAITRYRLYDIDVVISRTFVVFIGVVYVGVVVGVGSLVGSGDEPNAVLSVGATALVAVGFQPVRRRLERVANRLVFGRKATPYEVLSEFSRRVAATSDDLLDDAARSLAEGTRAERVVISVMVDGEAAEAAAWPVEPPSGSTEPVSFSITDGDTTLGSLDVYLPSGQQLQDDDRRLAEQLSSGMGLALRNQLLTERLEARVEELRESRRRLVAVQDETRRRLERDLHDGAQQQLVALKVKLGLGRAIAAKDDATQTAELLERLSGEADAAVDAMREFARGVYPPLLEAEGLASAIGAQARRAPIPVSVDSDGIGRYPREIESTVYFCVLEALRNTVRHANASEARVNLSQDNGSLEFQVTDDGTGFDQGAGWGVGLTAMADRLDALTGDLSIHTEPGNGTTLTGTIPVPAQVPA